MATLSTGIRAGASFRVHRPTMHLAWVVAGWALGFFITALFSGILELSRPWLVAVYLALAGPFLAAYARWSDLDLAALLRRRWLWGLAGAAVIGVMVTFTVQGWEASPRPDGLQLAFDILWLGVVYGMLDAIFLSVFPVIAVWRAFPDRTATWRGKVAIGALAMLASLIVTTTYHIGYEEFRGEQIREALVGNGVFTLGYLLTTNPVAAIVGHVVLHIASVLHGAATTVSLPPHY